MGDAPAPSPAPAPQGEKPPFPTRPDYHREGFPTCIANSTDVEARCKCDPAWCRYFSEQQAWDRWEKEHADDQTGEINTEKEAAIAADRAAAAAADKAAAENPTVVEDFIEAVLAVKKLLERGTASPEEKCQCSIGDRGDGSSGQSGEYKVSVLGPREPGVATAAGEVGDTIGQAVGGLTKMLEEALKAN